MPELTRSTDTIERAVTFLRDPFNEDPGLSGMVRAIAKTFEAIASDAYDVWLKRQLPEAEGAQLDLIGRVVGQPRLNDWTDDEYRVWLTVRIKTIKAHGTPNDLISIAGILLASEGYRLRDPGYATATLSIVGVFERGVTMLQTIKDALRRVKPAGVRLITVYGTEPTQAESTSFEYGTAYASVLPAVAAAVGFGSIYDASAGGYMRGSFDR